MQTRFLTVLLLFGLIFNCYGERTLIYGHRGAAGLSPENSLYGYQTALALGVDFIDLDVGMTKDGVVVVSHDFHLNPSITQDQNHHWLRAPTPLIKDLTYAELQQYDVGKINPLSKYAEKFPAQYPVKNTRIPSLRSVIQMANKISNNQIKFQIELKTSPVHPNWTMDPKLMAKAVAQILTEENAITRAQVHSFDWRGLIELHKINPEIKLSFITEREWYARILTDNPSSEPLWHAGLLNNVSDEILFAFIRQHGGMIWCPFYKDVTKQRIQLAHAAGLQVIVWSVDKGTEMETLINQGVDGIITNRPDILRGIVAAEHFKLPPGFQ